MVGKVQSVRKAAKSFGGNDKGGVAIMFGLSAICMLGFVGLAVDGSRAFGAKTKAVAALDAAALAATRAIIEGETDEDAVNTIAERVFLSNVENAGSLNADYPDFDTDIDFDTKTVRASVTARTPTLLGGLFGVDQIAVPTSATATFNVQDIELSIQLDLTGSMCEGGDPAPCTVGPKIGALKQATKDLIDIMMPDNRLNQVRVAFAPFGRGVNAGNLAADVRASGAGDSCVYERAGSDAATDASPTVGGGLQTHSDLGIGANRCPADGEVIPLSDDKDALKATVDTYQADGITAGHLGTAWAWYMVSPRWSDVLPAASAPAEYNNSGTRKAVVLMTDGVYNTFGGRRISPTTDEQSQTQAMELCQNMKEEGVIIYSVLFMEDDADAVETMSECATVDESSGSRNFFQADNPEELLSAFRDIGVRLTALRLAQ